MTAPNHRWFRLAMNTVYSSVGFLSVGAIIGAYIGWEAMSYYLLDKGTDREWWEPGLYEKWRLGGTLSGAAVGIAIGLVIDIAKSYLRRRHSRPPSPQL